MEKKRINFVERGKKFWQRQLFASDRERRKWPIDLDELKHIIPEELRDTEITLRTLTYPRDLVKRTDLDRYFQARVGKVLSDYCLVSVRTVSRLVVLLYWCAGLAEQEEGQLVVKHMRISGYQRLLTVDSVYQKLRDAGLR